MNRRGASSGPRLARGLLRWAAPPGGEAEAIVGDIEEEYRVDVLPRLGSRASQRWYWSQVARSAVPLIGSRVVERRRLRAVLLGWVAATIGFFGTASLVVGVDAVTPLPVWLTVGLFLSAVAIGGTLAGWTLYATDRPDPLGPLMMAGVLLLSVAALFRASPEPETPLWWVLWGGLVVLGLALGGRVGRMRTRGPRADA